MTLPNQIRNRASITKRIFAFLIDYIVIVCFILLSFGLSYLLNQFFPFWKLLQVHYIARHVTSFLLLSLPVFLYFFLSEKGKNQATLGKRAMGLQVTNTEGEKAQPKCVLLRNLFKFMPWELAHLILHISFPMIVSGQDSLTTQIALIIPLLLIFIYILLIFIRKDQRSIYEIWSGTEVNSINKLLSTHLKKVYG